MVDAVVRKVKVCNRPEAREYEDLDMLEERTWYIKNMLDEAKDRETRSLLRSLGFGGNRR